MLRKIISFILLFTLICFHSNISVYAKENDLKYDFIEVSTSETVIEYNEELPRPYTLYIMNVITHIIDKGNGTIHVGAEVYCTQQMKKITVKFYLQQAINNKWVTVATATVSEEDTDFLVRFVYASNPGSGTYRAVASAMVEDYNGYAEATDGYSGDINFVNPYL